MMHLCQLCSRREATRAPPPFPPLPARTTTGFASGNRHPRIGRGPRIPSFGLPFHGSSGTRSSTILSDLDKTRLKVPTRRFGEPSIRDRNIGSHCPCCPCAGGG